MDPFKINNLPGINALISLETADSTQSVAKELACSGAGHGTLVITATQTQGRGQFERKWESAAGGIYISLLLRPCTAPEHFKDLSIKIAQTLAGTINRLYKLETKVKPPNDVFVLHPHKNKFCKAAGILIEASTDSRFSHWLVAGIGINLNNNIPRTLPDAASIRAMTSKTQDGEKLLREFFTELWGNYAQWETSVSTQI